MNKKVLDMYIKSVEMLDEVTKNVDGSYWNVNGDSTICNLLDIACYSDEEFIRTARECGAIITMTCKEENDYQTACFVYNGLSVSTLVFKHNQANFEKMLEEIR